MTASPLILFTKFDKILQNITPFDKLQQKPTKVNKKWQNTTKNTKIQQTQGKIMINNLLTTVTQGDIIKIAIAVGVLALILFIARYLYKKSKEPNYFVKDKLLTQTELAYYNVIRELIDSRFIILPQVNLASVLDKKGGGNFRTELFRNIDFGVFDSELHPIFLIEINDNTHLRKDRKERDKRVNKICKKAEIPLVTFWVRDGINKSEMYRELKNALNRGLKELYDR